MTWNLGWISVTRVIGLAGYGISLGICLTAFLRCSKRERSGSLFAALAAAQLFLMLDMAFDWRWKLHAYWMQEAVTEGVYGARRSPQLLGLVVLACLALCCAGLILMKLRHRLGAALALTGTVLSMAMWASEAISYHYLDLILYRKVGGAMLVSFVWIALAVVTSFGAVLDMGGRETGLTR